MYDFTLLALIVAAIAIATPILALAAFMRTGAQSNEIAQLRAELARLRRDTSDPAPHMVREEVRPQPQPAAAPPRPDVIVAPPAPPRAEPAAAEPSAAAVPPPHPPVPSPPPPPPPRPPVDWGRASSTFERLVVANWLIWVGALALALGGIFLVRFAWEQGYFGPEARTITAVAAGAAMIGWSEWIRRRADPDARGQIPHAPLAVATAGAVTLYASAYAAGPLYSLVPPMVALTGFVVASVAAVVLAMVHGVFLAALGLAGAYFAPLLVGGGTPEPLLVLGYVLVVTLGALVLVRAFDWRRLVWVALSGAAMWTLIGWTWSNYDTGPLALTIYLLALVAASCWLAWDDANTPATPPNQTVFAANGFWLLAAAGLLLPLSQGDRGGHLDPILVGVVVYAAGAMAAGWQRIGFVLTPFLGAAALVIATAAMQPDDPASAWRFQMLAWTGAAITGVGGWLAMRAMPSKGLMAAISAFTPIILLALAFVRLGNFEQGFQWGMAGGLIALLNLLALEGLSRGPGGLDAHKAASSAYALGAFAASMFAVASSLQQMWMTALFALHLPAIALIDRRFNLPALKLAASIAGLVATARLVIPGELLSYTISPVPIINELLPLYVVPILSFWAAARIFQSSLKDAQHTIVQAFDVGAIVLTAVFLSVEVRHLVTGGNLAADYEGLVETGAYCLSWTGLALGLAARQGKSPRLWLDAATQLVATVAIVIAIFGLGFAFNPLLAPNAIPGAQDGPILLNLMAPSYLAPAALLTAYGWLRRQQRRVTAGHIAGFTALALVFLYVSLEVRNYFHADLALQDAPVEQAESYAYSVAWILFSVATLFVGIARKQVSIRHAAMAVLALSVVKVFVFDMASLEGVLRAASFFGLGIALIGIALLYQRLIFGREPKAPDAAAG